MHFKDIASAEAAAANRTPSIGENKIEIIYNVGGQANQKVDSSKELNPEVT